MTIDKNTWQKLAKEYPTRAAWVRGLNDLTWGEHEDLYSALIELDSSDLAPEPRLAPGSLSVVDGYDFAISALDTTKIVDRTDKVQDALDKAEESLKQSNEALARVDALLEDSRDKADEALNQSNVALERLDALLEIEVEDDLVVNISFGGSAFDSDEIVSVINRELGRDLGPFRQ